jgi:molybdopterin-binding protein
MSVTAVNTRNQLRGTVVAIRRGDVMSEVEIESTGGLISAVVTTSSVDRLPLRVGDSTLALFKATDVLLARLDD